MDEACALYRRALAAAPRYAPAYLNLGAALEARGDAAAAERAYRALLDFDAHNPFASYNVANLLAARGDAAAAVPLLRAALAHKPQFPEARVALAYVLEAQGAAQDAAEQLRLALEQRPQYAGAWHNYGLLLRKLDQVDAAEAALRRAVELDHAPALPALAALLRGEARTAEALELYAAARAKAPERFDLESSELFTLLYSEAIGDAALFERHRAFGARLEALHASAPSAPARSRDPQRRLKIGYVSSDLYRHPVALFLIPVLERHERAAFEVYCYKTGVLADEVTAQLRASADAWREAARLSDAQLAQAVREDGIDILVDLTGHAGDLRLGVFAQQPAPVQVSWLGYLHSTGLRRIQYRLCDRHTDPPGPGAALHTERLVRLPDSQWCYRPLLDVAPAAQPPCVRKGYVTFGSFNHFAKISPATRRRWGELLACVPDARLLVAGARSESAKAGLLRELAAAGVAPERVTLAPRASLDRYFALFAEVDIALDTLTYGGGTTTCDALWMGVPVVTAPGTRSVSRSAASLLATLGLADWVAGSPDEYAALAARKAADPAALAALRPKLRALMQASPLMDEPRFTRNLEAAYRRFWRDWCDNRAA